MQVDLGDEYAYRYSDPVGPDGSVQFSVAPNLKSLALQQCLISEYAYSRHAVYGG